MLKEEIRPPKLLRINAAMSMPGFEESSRILHPVRTQRKVYDLPAARETLPLVSRVLDDAARQSARFAHLKLRSKRHAQAVTDWESKKAIYRLRDEMESCSAELRCLTEELEDLGIELLDAVRGAAGYPTIVNGSLAYLVYVRDETDIKHWRYRDQPKLRPIPPSWYHEVPVLTEQPEEMLQ